MEKAILEAPGFFAVLPLKPFRKTPGVIFDSVPLEYIPGLCAVQRVLHQGSAISPGPVGGVARPWYMHPFQDDNLVVLQGERRVELYDAKTKTLAEFLVAPDALYKDGSLLADAGVMLSWPKNVFHRIQSGGEGSASLNFAVHHPGMDPRLNFSIYDLDTATGAFKMIREGYKDQI